jgi:MFS family permease
MTITADPQTARVRAAAAAPPAWRWIHVAVAAAAMVGTLPGRTHGLGLVTEPLLRDLGLDRVGYAAINLWATLLGATFCLPCGWLIDRLGVRLVLTANLLLLGGVVVVMSGVPGTWWVDFDLFGRAGTGTGVVVLLDLFLLVLLTRGLGQSALSVVSLALVGKTAGRRGGLAIGVYSFLVAIGFMGAFATVKWVLEAWQADWRELWAGIGLAVLALAPLAAVLVRPGQLRQDAVDPIRSDDTDGCTLGQALWTPAFWVFALGTSLYGLIAAGVSLFNQSILAERGFDRDVFLTITTLTPLVGLVSNLATGWLAGRWPMGRLLCAALLLLAGALLAFPLVQSLFQVYAYAALLGVAGGLVTVIFFGVWGQVFGTAHLGKIQGAAQMLTVLASAVGPLLLAASKEASGSYVLAFQCLAGCAVLLGLAAWWVSGQAAGSIAQVGH